MRIQPEQPVFNARVAQAQSAAVLTPEMRVRFLPRAPLSKCEVRGPRGEPTDDCRPFFAPHTSHLPEGRQIQAGCTCPENRIGLAPRSEHYRRLPPLSNAARGTQTAETYTQGFHSAFRVPRPAFIRPVAQKQSARLITGRPGSVTPRDDHFQNPQPKGCR